MYITVLRNIFSLSFCPAHGCTFLHVCFFIEISHFIEFTFDSNEAFIFCAIPIRNVVDLRNSFDLFSEREKKKRLKWSAFHNECFTLAIDLSIYLYLWSMRRYCTCIFILTLGALTWSGITVVVKLFFLHKIFDGIGTLIFVDFFPLFSSLNSVPFYMKNGKPIAMRVWMLVLINYRWRMWTTNQSS